MSTNRANGIWAEARMDKGFAQFYRRSRDTHSGFTSQVETHQRIAMEKKAELASVCESIQQLTWALTTDAQFAPHHVPDFGGLVRGTLWKPAWNLEVSKNSKCSA